MKKNIDSNKTHNIGFFDSVYKSISDINAYKYWVQSPLKKSITYLLLLVLALTPLSSIKFVYTSNKKISSFMQAVNTKLPQATFSNGILNAGSDKPIILIDSQTLLMVVDTSDSPQESIFNKNNRKIILVEKDKMLEKNWTDADIQAAPPSLKNIISSVNTFDFSSFGNVSFNMSDVEKIVPILRLLTISIVLVEFVHLFVSMFFHALLLAILGLVVCSVRNLKTNYSTMLKITLHCITLPAIVGIILTAANTPASWWLGIYYGIGVFYVIKVASKIDVRFIK